VSIDTLSNGVISIVLPGDPITKMRHRSARHKTGIRTYDPQNDDKNTVRWMIKARMVGKKPLQGPLIMSMVCVIKRPKSREKLKEIYVMVKPDYDNLAKWIGDVGNGILWYDDAQIVSAVTTKIYGEHPRTIITVSKT
jgi:Holliday junction resolvase RusA-like endonuclease